MKKAELYLVNKKENTTSTQLEISVKPNIYIHRK